MDKIGETDADVNGDGIVDIRDLVIVAGAFGGGAAAPSLLRQQEAVHLTSQDLVLVAAAFGNAPGCPHSAARR